MQNNGQIHRNARDEEEAGAFSPSHTPAITPACVDKKKNITYNIDFQWVLPKL